MKNLAEGNNARGAIKSASKVLAWALGVMLIVTGIVPGFAAESKASNQNGEKVVVSDSTTKKPEDSVKERERKANPVILKDKCYEMRRKKAIKCKKTIRIQRPVKRGVTYNLNKSGNVKAIKDNDGNINVTATNTSGDMKIDRQKWIDMVLALGGEYSTTDIGLTWSSDKRTFNFNTNGIRLPDNSHTLFRGFKGPILGCGKLNTSNVTNMRGMFWTTEEANPDVLNWDLSLV